MLRARPLAGSASVVRSLAAAAAALPALLLPTEAAAEPSWRSPLKVEASPAASVLSFPKAVARPAGCTTVAFERGEEVFASTRPPGGTFGALQGLGDIAPGEYPAAARGGGVAALAWEQSGAVVRIVTANDCEPLGPPAEVPVAAGFADDVTAAVTADGTAIAAFGAGGSGNRKIYLSERAPGASPSTPTPLAPPAGTEAFRPTVAANATGGAAVVFDVVAGGNQVYASRRTGPGTWSTPVKLNEAAANAGTARAALAPDGTVYATWVDSGNDEVILATLSPTGTVTTTPLIIAGGTVREPAIAIGAEGRVAIVWAEQVGGGTARIYGKYAEPGGSLSTLKSVSAASGEFRGNPYVAIDRGGRTIVAWSAVATSGATQRTLAAVRQPGSTGFFGEQPISNPAQYTSPAAISSDEEGNTVVALYMTESPREAQVAAFDAAGPLLPGLAVPASGVAGTPLAFSVSPLDAWSPIGAASWQFGDGGSAVGDAVSHTYAAAGSFGIGLSVADSLGNLSTATGTTAITAAPTGDGGPGPSGGAPGSGSGTVAGPGRPDPNAGPRTVDLPRISRLVLDRKSFPVGTGPAGGTWISFRLSTAAQVRFRVKPLRSRASGTAGASREVRTLAFRRRGKPRRNRFFFSGRIGPRALLPGRYRMRLVAVDAAGRRSQPRAVSFTVR